MEFLIGRSLANNITNLLLALVGRRGRGDEGAAAGRAHGAGAGRRAGQRRAGPAGRLLHRLAGDAPDPRDRLRPALRLRHLPPGAPRRLPGRAAGPLAEPARPVGGGPAGRDGLGAARPPASRSARARSTVRPRPADAPARRPVRPPGGRLRRRHDQHPAAVAGRDARTSSTSASSAAATSSAAVSDRVLAESVTRVLYPDDSTSARPVAAVPPGILPRPLLAGRHRRPLPPTRERLAGAARTRSPSSSTTPTRRWPSPN